MRRKDHDWRPGVWRYKIPDMGTASSLYSALLTNRTPELWLPIEVESRLGHGKSGTC